MHDLVFSRAPSLAGAYLRAALLPRSELQDGAPPPMSARWAGLRVDDAALARYRDLCGSRAEVPVTWPQAVATRLHVVLVTDARFPLRPTGLVHPRFSLTQHRPLQLGDVFDLEVEVGGRRDTPTGFEFDLTTRVRVDGVCVWESAAATYVRLRRAPARAEPPAEEWDAVQPVAFPADAGRAYARLSGDWNLIHVHPLTARLFGFRRPIAHGWYLLARCLGALDLDGPRGSATLAFDLLRPTLLPCELRLGWRSEGDGTRFVLFDTDRTPRVAGELTPV